MNTYVLSVVQQKSRARHILPSWGRVTERTIKHVYCPFRNFYYIIYQMSTESHLSEHLLRAGNSVYPFRWNRQIVVKAIGSGSVNGYCVNIAQQPAIIRIQYAGDRHDKRPFVEPPWILGNSYSTIA